MTYDFSILSMFPRPTPSKNTPDFRSEPSGAWASGSGANPYRLDRSTPESEAIFGSANRGNNGARWKDRASVATARKISRRCLIPGAHPFANSGRTRDAPPPYPRLHHRRTSVGQQSTIEHQACEIPVFLASSPPPLFPPSMRRSPWSNSHPIRSANPGRSASSSWRPAAIRTSGTGRAGRRSTRHHTATTSTQSGSSWCTGPTPSQRT